MPVSRTSGKSLSANDTDFSTTRGFSLWVEHPPVDNRKLMDVLQRNKVIVLTGEHFSSDGCFTHHLRINYALPLIPRRLNGIKILGKH